MRQGRFREDLWFRLKTERLVVPPLRERGSDVLLLARHFLELLARARGRRRPAPRRPRPRTRSSRTRGPATCASSRARCCGSSCVTPGAASARDELSAEIAAAPRPGGTLRLALRRVESEMVREALARHEGRQARAAAELGITRQALWAKLRRLGG